jgi:hypothetical protein
MSFRVFTGLLDESRTNHQPSCALILNLESFLCGRTIWVWSIGKLVDIEYDAITPSRLFLPRSSAGLCCTNLPFVYVSICLCSLCSWLYLNFSLCTNVIFSPLAIFSCVFVRARPCLGALEWNTKNMERVNIFTCF